MLLSPLSATVAQDWRRERFRLSLRTSSYRFCLLARPRILRLGVRHRGAVAAAAAPEPPPFALRSRSLCGLGRRRSLTRAVADIVTAAPVAAPQSQRP